MGYLIAIDIATCLDGSNVCVLRKDLVHHRAVVLSICVLMKSQLRQILQLQWLSSYWIFVMLPDERNCIDNVKDASIW